MRTWNVVARITVAGVLAAAGTTVPAAAQRSSAAVRHPAGDLPDAPAPRLALAAQGSGGAEQGSAGTMTQNTAAQDGQEAGGASAVRQTERQEHHEKARQQLKTEEEQRVLGMVPMFGTTYVWNAASLSAGQKMSLAFRSAIDPFTFAAAVLVAGSHEALDDEPGFQWGAAGFGQRAGAAYLDAFDGNMIGGGILPALLHQDPRYFRMGHGSFRRRLFYAIEATVVCRGDKGRNEVNYSNIGGNLAAGAISNLYYPEQKAGWGQTIGNGLIVTAENTAGGIFDEFWPDISRTLFHRDPTRGTDGKAAAASGAKP